MALRCYYDLMSQPSRAVYMFLRLNNVPYEDKPVALRKGEHLNQEFASISPFKLVPVIEDNGFQLTESIAIVDYISNTRQVSDHWYPKSDPKKRARVSEYLHWQHLNTRGRCATFFRNSFLIPRITGRPVNEEKVAKEREEVQKVVRNLESYFLRSTPFISSNNITVADLFAACELMQLYAIREENLYESSPVVKAWLERVHQETNPLFDEAHQIVYKVRDTYKNSAKL